MTPLLSVVPEELPTGPYYVGPVFLGAFPIVECATWAEAVTVALTAVADGRAVVVRDGGRHLVTTGRRLAMTLPELRSVEA